MGGEDFVRSKVEKYEALDHARISKPSSELKSRVDDFIESGIWVDLERTFKRSWITGGSTGLKVVAPLAGFGWDVDDPGGAMSMVYYLEATADSTEAQEWLVDYNRGDVEATMAIREWFTLNGQEWSEVPITLPQIA